MGYSHGRKWSDEIIEKEIKNIQDALNIDRMPSNSEIRSVIGAGLGNKISRTGGFKYWADKLGLNIKESETKVGNEWESQVKELLENMSYEVEKMTTKHPYDLLINNNIKVDIKVSRYYKNETFKYHTFNLERRYHNCDIFICIGLNDNDEIEKLLIIPSKYLMGIKQLSVGIESKYDEFDKAYKYLELYDKFYKEVV